jgi:hypothetical protein
MKAPGGLRNAGLVVLGLYALIFVLLSIDIMVRVWGSRFHFDSPLDVLALLYLESVRTLVTLAGVTIAAVAAYRARQRPALVWFAAAVLFATVAYTKVMAFGGFPGTLQEQVALALRAREVPDWLLLTVFAHPQWALWLALPPLLLFAGRYPRKLQAREILGTEDGREGTLRSVAVAGGDVGSAARRMTAALLQAGALRPAPLWTAALIAAVWHTAALQTGTARTGVVVNVAAAMAIATTGAVLLTLFRTSSRQGGLPEKLPLRWMQRGGEAALVLFAIAAVAGLALPGGAISTGAFSLAPVALAGGLFMAVLKVPSSLEPEPAAPPQPASTQPGDPDLVMLPEQRRDGLQ